ncbi:MAG: DUF3426 domain-containing protein [Gammaproteobacteria bacterium]|nr:DUF3426 domain-containing protein [Gammaproteobacteria bacterium]
MLVAQCPKCGTAFKVSLSELGVASGQLQCGQCQALFHAEDPIKISDEVEAFTPQKFEPDAFAGAGSRESGVSQANDVGLEPLDLDLDAIAQDEVTLSQTSAEPPASVNAPYDGVVAADAESEGLAPAKLEPDHGDAEKPESGHSVTLTSIGDQLKAWALPVLLGGVLVFQLIWVGTDRALSHSGLYGLMAGGCLIFGCHVPPFQDVTRLALDDVSMTAWSGGRAQVSARLLNKASRAQGLPVLRFVLQDNSGRDLGQKLLTPGVDYQLQEAALIHLEPDAPQMLAFEVLAQKPYTNAASYRLELVNPL